MASDFDFELSDEVSKLGMEPYTADKEYNVRREILQIY